MKRFLIATGCVWALALCALAAPPVEVPGEVKGDVGAFVAIRATTAGKVVKFVPLDPGLNVFPADLLADKKATVVSASKPGKYRVLAYSSVKDDPTEPVVVTVVIGDGAPPVPPKPEPGPNPQPDPAPVPQADKVFVILVEDAQAARTVELARALNDPWWATLKPKHEYRFYQSDSATAKANGYTAEAERVGYPATLVLDAKDGTVLKRFKFAGIESVKTAVKEVAK